MTIFWTIIQNIFVIATINGIIEPTRISFVNGQQQQQQQQQQQRDYFYLNPAARPVKEYISDNGIEKNLFMNEKGPKVVEFYSPLCVSNNLFVEIVLEMSLYRIQKLIMSWSFNSFIACLLLIYSRRVMNSNHCTFNWQRRL
jgi:hypothetical protein